MSNIRRIKARATKGSKCHVIAVVAGDSVTNEVEYIEVVFLYMTFLPKPNTLRIVLTLDNINDCGSKIFIFKELSFSRNPVGSAYPATFTMKNANNQTVGKPITLALSVDFLGSE